MKHALPFLTRLKTNNTKEWFDRHKDQYLLAREEYAAFLDDVIARIRKFDPAIEAAQTGASCMFRIYKDVRFSKDKTPYKTNFGASINPGGRRSSTAGYYLHFEPANSFLAGGIWMPDGPMLARIRQEIDYNPAPLLNVMKSSGFKKFFKGFDEEGKMKSTPKGFAKDHPLIEILKNRNFIVSAPLKESDFSSPEGLKKITAAFRAMHPLITYLRAAQEE